MMSYEVHGERVSSSAVRAALAAGDMDAAAALLGRPYSITAGSGAARPHARRTAQLGDGFRTLNLRFRHPKPAAMGIFVVRVHGLADRPLDGVASLGMRPTVDDSGRVLLEVHCFDWPRRSAREGGYGRLVRVELLQKLRDEARYDSLAELRGAIGRDAADARAFLAADAAAHAATGRQTTRDRI